MRRRVACALAGIALAAMGFFAGRYSITVRPVAKVWIGQDEASLKRALGKPLDETRYSTIGGPVHILRYPGFIVHMTDGRVSLLRKHSGDSL